MNITDDAAQLRGKLIEIGTNAVNKATVRALNKLADQVKTAGSKEIRAAGYNMKAAAIKRQITIRRASLATPVVLIRCSGRPIPLIQFSARQISAGVSVSVKNGRKVIPGAFIATMPTGHKGVYVRVGDQHRRTVRNGKPEWSGLPIKELFGPGVSDAFGNEVVQQALLRLIQDKFPGILEHEITFLRK